jgi:predicted ester cyclase/ketosteroid isomerase-like protein
MRTTTTCWQCCVLLACVWPLQAQQPAAKDELIHLEKKWAEAGVKGDIGFFERIATADYVIVDCDGSVRNKQEEIPNFRQGTQTSQTVEDMKVRVYGRSAVVVGAFKITGTYAGQPNNLSGNFTDVWIHPNRTWQLVSTHNTCKPAEGARTEILSQHSENSAKFDTLEKNKAVLQRAHEEVWTKGNLAAADELYDPNYVYHATYGPDEKGLELFKKGIKDQHIAFPDWNEHVVQIIAAGDIVVTRFISSGTHKGPWVGIPPTGKRLKV